MASRTLQAPSPATTDNTIALAATALYTVRALLAGIIALAEEKLDQDKVQDDIIRLLQLADGEVDDVFNTIDAALAQRAKACRTEVAHA